MTGGQWEEKKKRRLVDVDGAKIQLDNNAIRIEIEKYVNEIKKNHHTWGPKVPWMSETSYSAIFQTSCYICLYFTLNTMVWHSYALVSTTASWQEGSGLSLT